VKKLMLILVMFVALTYSLNAQSSRFFLNLGTGLSTPIAETGFTDLYGMGLNLHAAGGMAFSDIIAGRLGVEHNRFPQSDNLFYQSGNFTITSIKADAMIGDVMGVKKVNPYGVIGLGAYILNVSVTNNNITATGSETDLGLGLGGGINFKLSPTVGLYTEAQYNVIFNDDGAAKGFLPLKVGISIFP
jgi:opacity protein-like surface antigen